LVFIETSVFTSQVRRYLSDEDYRLLQNVLANQPETGVVIPGSGGLRKIRWRFGGHGKRGGVRVIYYSAVTQDQLLMLFMYPKGVQENLSAAQLKA
jgi:hypothetical protein